MKLTDNPFAILFGIISIGLGVIVFLDRRLLAFTDIRILWGILAIAVIIILVVFLGKVKQPIGYLLLAFTLAFLWAINFYKLDFNYRDLILGIIPIAGGIFMLMGL